MIKLRSGLQKQQSTLQKQRPTLQKRMENRQVGKLVHDLVVID